MDFNSLALKIAKKSPCTKRKVGAVVVSRDSTKYRAAYNYALNGKHEDENGETTKDVIHAEINALSIFKVTYFCAPYSIYVTHKPCQNCKKAILEAGIKEENIHIVEDFLKFDEMKARLDLLPNSTVPFIGINNALWFKRWWKVFHPLKDSITLKQIGLDLLAHTSLLEVGEILAHGAKKYKPNNWRNAKDLNRYWNALGRHLFVMDIEGNDSIDKDSGLKHAAHAMCNVLFILELNGNDNK